MLCTYTEMETVMIRLLKRDEDYAQHGDEEEEEEEVGDGKITETDNLRDMITKHDSEIPMHTEIVTDAKRETQIDMYKNMEKLEKRIEMYRLLRQRCGYIRICILTTSKGETRCRIWRQN